MKDILEKIDLLKPLQIGKIIEGKIVAKAKSAVFLDLGPLGTGIIYGREFQESRNELKKFKIGEVVFTKVVDLENEEGYTELSLSQASSELNWVWLQQKKESGELIKIKILGANKGGLLAEVSGIPGFLPVSQLLPENYPRIEGKDISKITKELQKFIGKEMEVKIFDLDQGQAKLILSEKAKENERIREILNNYKVGDEVEGEITGITDFGVFIKFSPSATSTDTLEGLIHISELDWQLIEDPADIVKTGEKVRAKIISIINDKVSLSLKALKKDPWEEIEKEYKKGDIIEGTATKFNPFGAFIQLTPKIQGLCHISEFGTKTKMESTLEIGKKYKFQILSLEPKEHKMSLKLAE
ncbi:MAG: S1 RNA-binding domain-containing protein [bacterium]|nr:S1 RNA-binding domain-containing protein [bacterium]